MRSIAAVATSIEFIKVLPMPFLRPSRPHLYHAKTHALDAALMSPLALLALTQALPALRRVSRSSQSRT